MKFYIEKCLAKSRDGKVGLEEAWIIKTTSGKTLCLEEYGSAEKFGSYDKRKAQKICDTLNKCFIGEE